MPDPVVFSDAVATPEHSPAPRPENAPPPPRLSVVVGSHNARATAAECLDALTRQCAAQDAELIVVDHSDDGTAAVIRERFPAVRLIETREHAHIPELWAIGIRASAGDVVALTTAHCVPAPDWVRRTLAAHAQPYPGIGGAIDNHPAAGWAGWAIFFCRYSQYMRPFPEATHDEIAADNASYKRWALERYRDAWQHGFWEPTVHAEMRRDGYELLRTPGVVVYHKRSFTARGFVRNRFAHGRQFGIDRAGGLGMAGRFLRIARAPLVPFVMLGRAAREVIRKRRHRARFLAATPLILLFYTAWAAGEAAGFLNAARRRA